MLPTLLSVRSDVEPIDPSQIPYWVSGNAQGTYVQVAIATALCYDTITTFDKEFKYFWSSPRKTASIVYFLSRYIGIVTVSAHIPLYSNHANIKQCKVMCFLIMGRINENTGNFFTWAGNLGDWMTIVLIDYILLMRVLALWSGEAKLAVYLKALFAVESIFMLGIVIDSVRREKVSVVGAEGYTFCGEDGVTPPLFETLYWATPLVFELLLLVLALYKATSLWRESGGFKGVGLVKVLILDQEIYFAVVMICGVAHITFYWVDQDDSSNAVFDIVQAVLTTTTLPCIVGCGLLVHLNEAAERGVNGGTSYRAPSRSVSDIQFA